jgi:hypothetical protein
MQQFPIQLPALGIKPIHLPLFSHKVAAGFPSPAVITSKAASAWTNT